MTWYNVFGQYTLSGQTSGSWDTDRFVESWSDMSDSDKSIWAFNFDDGDAAEWAATQVRATFKMTATAAQLSRIYCYLARWYDSDWNVISGSDVQSPGTGANVSVQIDADDVNADLVLTMTKTAGAPWPRAVIFRINRWTGNSDPCPVSFELTALEADAPYPPAVAVAGTITEASDLTYFRLAAYDLTGSGVNTSEKIESGAYTLTTGGSRAPVMVACMPWIDRRWEPNAYFTAGNLAIPSDPVATPYVFECTTEGPGHVTDEPTWNTGTGSTTNDADAVWTCRGRLLQPIMQGPLIPS